MENQWDEVKIGSRAGARGPRVAKTEKDKAAARRAGAVVGVERKSTAANKPVVVHHQKIAALDRDNEVAPPNKIDPDVGKAIQAGRNAKKWTQKDLAGKINETARVIQDYESAKAIPSQPVLKKLERQLGVKLTGNNIGASLSSSKDKDDKKGKGKETADKDKEAEAKEGDGEGAEKDDDEKKDEEAGEDEKKEQVNEEADGGRADKKGKDGAKKQGKGPK